jgi:hypothetical protein
LSPRSIERFAASDGMDGLENRLAIEGGGCYWDALP